MAGKKRLLTGIRASGEIHLGNYFGAMAPAIRAQADFDSFLFIADFHGLTSSPPPDELRSSVRSVAAAWLACGADPNTCTLWRQSDVKEVLELSYILSCVTGLGLLERAHSYKDARAKSKQLRSGILFYPVLMAADILLFEADVVPVGKDQLQHLEMTRDMATFFNEAYSPVLKLPEAMSFESTQVLPGVDGRKMSKSYGNAIHLFSEEPVLKKEVMKIITDSKALDEPKNAEECLIYQIFKVVASADRAKLMKQKLEAGGYGYGDAKKELLQEILEGFSAMRQNYRRWIDHPSDIEDCLRQGAKKASEKAVKLMDRVRQEVGL
ncbi:MAG: tryptophan--tRNA ligase [Bradymonadales bacterium]|nr:MAG: tryptophan--tRNA ligase [Bradymonadales bacterium]